MAEPFLAEVRMMSFVFAPKGWALCNGQLLPINQNQGLFSLLGTTFGGDGRVNFALPDLRGRVPIHVGSSFTLGERGGESVHTLSIAELPAHSHQPAASSLPGNTHAPDGAVWAATHVEQIYSSQPGDALLGSQVPNPGNTGGSQAHLNMMPFLTLSYCIALQGIFPSPTK